MIVKLLTEHQLEFSSSKGGCKGSSESIQKSCQNTTLLEITCSGSNRFNVVCLRRIFDPSVSIGTYHIGEEPRLRSACTSVESTQSLSC